MSDESELKKPAPCPWCGPTDPDDAPIPCALPVSGIAVTCQSCWARGPIMYTTAAEAVAAWDRQAAELVRLRRVEARLAGLEAAAKAMMLAVEDSALGWLEEEEAHRKEAGGHMHKLIAADLAAVTKAHNGLIAALTDDALAVGGEGC